MSTSKDGGMSPEAQRIAIVEAIALTQGFVAFVDPEDLELISSFKWRAKRNGRTTYAISDTGGKRVWMHRIILGVNQRVDNIDNDGLNNRRSNLRLISNTDNIRRKRPNAKASSVFKGVSRFRGTHWQASIKVNGKSIWLGSFSSEKMAACAYDAAALIEFGQFTYLNFP